MTTASGLLKQVKYKVESAFGTVPAASSAQLLRRVSSSLDLSKDSFQSNEIRTDYQVADLRHGMRRVGGTISGELSPATYKDFLAAILKKDFAAGVSATGMSITVAASAPNYTITRAAGSFITDGFKTGDVVRLTAGSFNANNLNKNALIVSLSATVATVRLLDSSLTMTAEGPIASATLAVTGKKTLVPSTSHTDKSWSIEHWFADVPASEVFSGCKVSRVAINLPPTGLATIAIDFVGKDITTSASEYFTSPTAATTSTALAAVSGVVRCAGAAVANVTGLSLDISSAQSGEAVVGANTVPFLAQGRTIVTGSVTMTFESTTYRDLFINETDNTSVRVVLTTSSDAAADFIGFNMERVKFQGATKDDGEKTLTMTLPFQALLYQAGGSALDATTISIQDSAA